MTRHVLITGGAGYIGSLATKRFLDEGWRVTVLDNLMYGRSALYRLEHPRDTFIETLDNVSPERFEPSLFRLENFDIRDYDRLETLLRRESFDTVVHLAAIVGVRACAEQQEAAWEINVHATEKLVRLCEQHAVQHFVFASTYSVYGNQAGACVYENSELLPTEAYSEAKTDVESFLTGRLDFPYTILRFATACGLSYRTRFDLLSNQLTAQAADSGEIKVYQKEDMRSFVHVHDIARAIFAVAAAPRADVFQECFNVGEAFEVNEAEYGKLSCSKEELAKLIQSVYQQHEFGVSVKMDPYTEDARNAILIAIKLRQRLGFVPERTLTDAIGEICELMLSRDRHNIDPFSEEYVERAGSPQLFSS